MQSLSELNNASNELVTYTDERLAGITLTHDVNFYYNQINISSTTVVVNPVVDIEEIIHSDTANVRYQIIIHTERTPALTGSSITFATLPSGVTQSVVGSTYTLSNITTIVQWNTIKTATWNLPANWASCPLWYLEFKIIYFDEELNQDNFYSWLEFDTRFYYISQMVFNAAVTARISTKTGSVRDFNAALTSDFTSLIRVSKNGSIEMYSNFGLSATPSSNVPFATLISNSNFSCNYVYGYTSEPSNGPHANVLCRSYMDTDFNVNLLPSYTFGKSIQLIDNRSKITCVQRRNRIMPLTTLIAFSTEMVIYNVSYGFGSIINASSSLSSTPNRIKKLLSTLTSSASLSLSSKVLSRTSASLSSNFNLSTQTLRVIFFNSNISSSSIVSSTGRRLRRPVANLNSTFSISATLTYIYNGFEKNRNVAFGKLNAYEFANITIFENAYTGNYTTTISTQDNLARFSTSEYTEATVGCTYTGTRTQVNTFFSNLLIYPSNYSYDQTITITLTQVDTGTVVVNKTRNLHVAFIPSIPTSTQLYTTTTTIQIPNSVRYYGKITVAGVGGGGGGSRGAGGGSGGYLANRVIYFNAGNLYTNTLSGNVITTVPISNTITIGTGGLSGDNNAGTVKDGFDGTNTTFLNIIYQGGQGGGYGSRGASTYGGASGGVVVNSTTVVASNAGGIGFYNNVEGAISWTEWPAGGTSTNSTVGTLIGGSPSSSPGYGGRPGYGSAGVLAQVGDDPNISAGGGGGGTSVGAGIPGGGFSYSNVGCGGTSIYPPNSGSIGSYNEYVNAYTSSIGSGGGGGHYPRPTVTAGQPDGAPSNGSNGRLHIRIEETDQGI